MQVHNPGYQIAGKKISKKKKKTSLDGCSTGVFGPKIYNNNGKEKKWRHLEGRWSILALVILLKDAAVGNS